MSRAGGVDRGSLRDRETEAGAILLSNHAGQRHAEALDALTPMLDDRSRPAGPPDPKNIIVTNDNTTIRSAAVNGS